mmetsp:Transcript_61102/g.92394  ORF Transcript_61102/g.92394 Transcript_61102/m.92394 type:complete len:89 (+) Transcript_61102:547-813(+)
MVLQDVVVHVGIGLARCRNRFEGYFVGGVERKEETNDDVIIVVIFVTGIFAITLFWTATGRLDGSLLASLEDAISKTVQDFEIALLYD